ncbi:hypothetical protein [Pseudobutyrivibrio ruminis]|uniref:Uncharacterized protein n=1 Tax=Pseudobutyrivibrio ruminis TaxID=46206 RepID=A0A2G3DX37_9FIRM|nr:hypothetical protein [Pseudobutyrivibrio ruminis]PHU35607.1 hypothetical protein CSX01_03120 [Pseudobutyrivibrio ruminis]
MKRKMILQLLVVSVIVTGCGKSESSNAAASSDEAISSNVVVSDETTVGGEVSQTDSTSDLSEETSSEDSVEDSAEGYKKAYIEAAKSIKEKHDFDSLKFGLIDFDGDDTPELVAKMSGSCWLYTYEDGKLRCLMDGWVYGNAGDLGYEYAPGKGIVVDGGSPFYGALYYSAYFSKHEEGELVLDYKEEEYHFDDKDGDGFPSDEELEGFSEQKVFKMEYTCENGENLSEDQVKEKIDSYNSYTFEFLEGTYSYEEFIKELS